MTVEPLEASQTTEPIIPPGPQWDAGHERRRQEYIATGANRFLSAALRISYDALANMINESDEALSKRNPADAPALTREKLVAARAAIYSIVADARILPHEDGTYRMEYGQPAPEAPAPTTPTPETPTT